MLLLFTTFNLAAWASSLTLLFSKPLMAPLLLVFLALLLAIRLLDGRAVPFLFRLHVLFSIPLLFLFLGANMHLVLLELLALGVAVLLLDEAVYVFGPILSPFALAADINVVLQRLRKRAPEQKS